MKRTIKELKEFLKENKHRHNVDFSKMKKHELIETILNLAHVDDLDNKVTFKDDRANLKNPKKGLILDSNNYEGIANFVDNLKEVLQGTSIIKIKKSFEKIKGKKETIKLFQDYKQDIMSRNMLLKLTTNLNKKQMEDFIDSLN